MQLRDGVPEPSRGCQLVRTVPFQNHHSALLFFFVFPAFGLRPACRGASTNKQNTPPISSYNFAKGRISSAKRNSRKEIPRFRNCSQHHFAWGPPCGQCPFRDRTKQTWAENTPLPHASCNVQLEAVLH